MPVEYAKTSFSKEDSFVKRISLYSNQKQIQRNYCAFWSKDKEDDYIEEFVELLKQEISNSAN